MPSPRLTQSPRIQGDISQGSGAGGVVDGGAGGVVDGDVGTGVVAIMEKKKKIIIENINEESSHHKTGS